MNKTENALSGLKDKHNHEMHNIHKSIHKSMKFEKLLHKLHNNIEADSNDDFLNSKI